jgi:AcrR family transcriptional regulator
MIQSPRSDKGRSTKQSLVGAAREVLLRDGHGGSRVSDIAAAAGLSTGAFYRYFNDKREIMIRVIEEFLAVSRANVHVPFDPADPMSSVLASTARYFSFYRENADLWRAVIEAGQIDPEVEAMRLQEVDDWCARISHMLERGVRLGLVRNDIDPGVASYLLGGMAQFYAQHAFRPASGLETDPELLAAEVAKLWESGAFLTAGASATVSS